MNAQAKSLEEQLQFGFGDRLAKALQVANISNNEMAAYLGKSRTSVSNWIHGRAPISRGDLVAWALKTGVPLEWLETGIFPETPETEKAPTPKGEGQTWALRDSNPRPSRCKDEVWDNVIPMFAEAA